MLEIELLFSYGTLQQPDVQRATFGRLLTGRPDELPGYRLGIFLVQDAGFVASSGKAAHATALHTGDLTDCITGTVLELTAAEIVLADAYEPEGYERRAVTLRSGIRAWIYATVTSS